MKKEVVEKTGEAADNINFSEELTKELQHEKLIQVSVAATEWLS